VRAEGTASLPTLYMFFGRAEQAWHVEDTEIVNVGSCFTEAPDFPRPRVSVEP
jgi:hypothetical protein